MVAATQPAPHVRDILSELYAKKTGKVLQVYQMAFEEPTQLYEPPPSKNTALVGTYLLGSGMFGKKTFYYDRISLEFLTSMFPIPLVGSIYSNLPVISEHFGIELTEDDVYDQVISGNSVQIFSKNSSYLYYSWGELSWSI